MLLAVLRPEQLECAGSSAVQQTTNFLRLWPLVGQNAIKQDDLRYISVSSVLGLS
jgi:hypothetical protein